VDEWAAGQLRGYLLIAYHLGKQNYLASLSLARGPKEYAIIFSLENHGDHPGWHVHTAAAPGIYDFATGCTRQRIWGIRLPGKGRYHRFRKGFDMGPIEARNIAYKAFRIDDASESGDLFS